jgi:hypothetical protein
LKVFFLSKKTLKEDDGDGGQSIYPDASSLQVPLSISVKLNYCFPNLTRVFISMSSFSTCIFKLKYEKILLFILARLQLKQ